MGRDIVIASPACSSSLVSIHAPAWGATLNFDGEAVTCEVSIHAPAWGATELEEVCVETGASFNPRARVGRDRLKGVVNGELVCFNPRARVGRDEKKAAAARENGVSIHAPAWGATWAQVGSGLSISGFNPRARVGRDTVTTNSL